MTAATPQLDRPLLAAVLDRLIPAGDGFPGAGSIATDYVLTTAERDPTLAALLAAGLAAVTVEAGGALFDVPDAEQDALLRRVEAAQPAFFDALVTHTYSGYYSNPLVQQLIGLEPGPPHPRGHLLEPTDWTILERVRALPPLYRE